MKIWSVGIEHEMARMRQVVILMMILMVGAISSTVLWSGSKTSLYEVQAAETTNNRTVKVGYYIAPGFQEYDESTGVYSGSSYEYLMVLKQYTGWQYEFVPVEFSDGVKMLENGQLDLMNNISKTTEREQTLDFSAYASGSNYGCLVVNGDNQTYAYNDYAAFDHMTVGLLNSSIYNSYFEDFCDIHNLHPEIKYYANGDKANAAMEAGEIDARIVSSSYQNGTRVVAKFAPMDYYFAVPKEQQNLLSELNSAMERIQTDMPDLLQNLEKRYEFRYNETNVVLTEAEKKYIEENPVVTVAVSDAWYPISYFNDKGQYTGPLAEIYQRISDATGINFEYRKYDHYAQALEAVKNREVDMISEFPYDFIFADQWNTRISDAVNDIAVYRVTNENTFTGEVQRIAVYGTTYLDENVKKLYGDKAEYISYENAESAVEAVLHGEVDCTFLNYYCATSYQNRGRYITLKYVLMPSLHYEFGLGISDDTALELKSIIGKGLQTIHDGDIESIFQEAAEHNTISDLEAQFYRNPKLFIFFFCILAVMIVLAAAFIFYSRRMGKKNVELERAKKAQSDFLSRMSHDMRTPMNGILGLTTLMKDKSDVEEIHKDLEQLQYSGKYLLNLINDTLDMNKIEAGKLELHPIPVSSQQLFTNVLVNARMMAEEKGLNLVVNAPDIPENQWVNVYADASRIQQIFMNLISNAIKYTPKGGMVTLTMENISVSETQVIDRYIISDTGIGMSEDFIPHMFEPFSMEGRANTDRQSGTGIGMSIVAQLVKIMKGQIHVESKINEGTTITLVLPYDRYQGIIEEDKKDNHSNERLKNRRVLMCEDHPLNAQIMEMLLEKVGIKWELAVDGEQGIQKFAASKEGYFDAVLMDIRMPKMDGVEATKRIRAMGRSDAKTIPIIAMTANAFAEDVKKCLEAGMNEHIAKPIEPELLYEVLEKWIEKQ